LKEAVCVGKRVVGEVATRVTGATILMRRVAVLVKGEGEEGRLVGCMADDVPTIPLEVEAAES
jgi:hypothetical protein